MAPDYRFRARDRLMPCFTECGVPATLCRTGTAHRDRSALWLSRQAGKKKRPEGRFLRERDARAGLLVPGCRLGLGASPLQADSPAHSSPHLFSISGYPRYSAVTLPRNQGVLFGSIVDSRRPTVEFYLPRPPSPTLTEARTSFSRAVVDGRNRQRPRLSPHVRQYAPARETQFRLLRIALARRRPGLAAGITRRKFPEMQSGS